MNQFSALKKCCSFFVCLVSNVWTTWTSKIHKISFQINILNPIRNEQESCIKGFIIMATLKKFRQRSHTPMKIGKSMRHKLRPRLIESLIFHATLARFPRRLLQTLGNSFLLNNFLSLNHCHHWNWLVSSLTQACFKRTFSRAEFGKQMQISKNNRFCSLGRHATTK